MTSNDPTDGTSTTALTTIKSWLQHRWTTYLSANEKRFTGVRAETIESTDGFHRCGGRL